jgi:hypothetical protein
VAGTAPREGTGTSSIGPQEARASMAANPLSPGTELAARSFEGTQRIAGRVFGVDAFRVACPCGKAPLAALRSRRAARQGLRPSRDAERTFSRQRASSCVPGARRSRAKLSCMNARDLATRLSDLLRREHEDLAEFLLALAEFDRMRGWEALGYSSLFTFLHTQLRLSKGAASYRATAAALLQRVPEVIEPLRDGRLCLSTIFEVAKVVTPENHADVLPRFLHRSKDEARELVAELIPVERPPAPTIVVPVRSAAVTASARGAPDAPPPHVARADHREARSASRPPRCQSARTCRERPTCPLWAPAVRAAHRRSSRTR